MISNTDSLKSVNTEYSNSPKIDYAVEPTELLTGLALYLLKKR